MDFIRRGITILGITTGLVGGILFESPVAYAEPTSSNSVQPPKVMAQHSAEDFFKQAFEKYKTDYQGAIEDLNQAIRINPNEAKFYYSRGLTRRRLSDSQTAIADYTLAIRTDPNYADAYYNRENGYCTVGDQPEAIKDYQKAANLYLKQGKLEDSQEALDRARRVLQQLDTKLHKSSPSNRQPC